MTVPPGESAPVIKQTIVKWVDANFNCDSLTRVVDEVCLLHVEHFTPNLLCKLIVSDDYCTRKK